MKDNETRDRFIELRSQGLPFAKIAAELNVSKTALINWERDFKEEIDNLRAIELEAMYDKYCLSVRKKVEFFGDVLSRIQRELETRELSESPAEKLFATYTLFYQEALHALPELTCHSDDDVRVARANQLPSSVDVMLYDH